MQDGARCGDRSFKHEGSESKWARYGTPPVFYIYSNGIKKDQSLARHS